ncbi:GDSL-type esterase/lipase family protein [uncultured Brevibacillus sp.]|uniref:GDSL-type esterase/lipase family protein n=1 Tax=uncultured Brevibacillus sp. TaxID=169970 RepID=UPI00259612EB|nr:GDSL-type esterase/lipase family protein [uncultured Brevibacillus sp.]
MIQKLVCLGDSLTEGFGVKKVAAWPALLQTELGIEVINKGISGDTTAGMLGRFYPEVIMQNPSHVLIMGGGNDMWWNVPINVMLANVYAMVKQALHHQITPIIGISSAGFNHQKIDASTVWEPIGGYEKLRESGTIYAIELKKMAQSNGWMLVSLQDLFLNAEGKVDHSYYEGTDGLHPNEKGHKRIAQAIAESLMKQATVTS